MAHSSTDLMRRCEARHGSLRGVPRWVWLVAVLTVLMIAVAVMESTALDPLAPPAFVHVTAPTGNVVYVNWMDSAETSGTPSYHVWRSTNGADYSCVATLTGDNGVAAYIDTPVSSSTKYWYAVSTIDERGESALSSAATSITTPAPPRSGTPTPVAESGPVWITWTPPNDPAVTGYYVLRATRSRGSFTTMTPASIDTTSYLDVTAEAGRTYWYKVRAVNGAGAVGEASGELAATLVVGAGYLPSPHGDSTTRADECAACHREHTGTGYKFMWGDGSAPTSPAPDPAWATAENQAACLFCHYGGDASDVKSSVEATTNGSRHPIAAGANSGSQYCGTCHTSHRVKQPQSDPVLVSVGGATTGNAVCFACHGSGSTLPGGDMSVAFGSSAHDLSGSGSRIGITCENCHEHHVSANSALLRYESYELCLRCHATAQADATEPDIGLALTLGADATSRHPLTASDFADGSRMTCENCHNSHAASSARPLVDPRDPEPGAAWAGSESAFCFRCHDGLALPSSAETSPWAGAVLGVDGTTTVSDIETAWVGRDGVGPFDIHGSVVASDTNLTLRGQFGYAASDALTCSDCHDPHGSVNAFALRQSIESTSGAVLVNGLTVVSASGGGYDLRFFCDSCHDLSPALHAELASATADPPDLTQFPIDCTRCHKHGSGGNLF